MATQKEIKPQSKVYFTNRPSLHGVVLGLQGGKIATVEFEDEQGLLVKKGRKKQYDIDIAELTVEPIK